MKADDGHVHHDLGHDGGRSSGGCTQEVGWGGLCNETNKALTDQKLFSCRQHLKDILRSGADSSKRTIKPFDSESVLLLMCCCPTLVSGTAGIGIMEDTHAFKCCVATSTTLFHNLNLCFTSLIIAFLW